MVNRPLWHSDFDFASYTFGYGEIADFAAK